MNPEQVEDCQLSSMNHTYEKPTSLFFLQHVVRKIYWAIFRRINYVINSIFSHGEKNYHSLTKTTQAELQSGDLVRVRSKEDIKVTLNAWNEFKGCAFMNEMWDYCGTTQRVFKKVEKFMDERDFQVKHVKGLFLLENVYCEGTKIFGKCDRSCFFFWRQEWLEKIEN